MLATAATQATANSTAKVTTANAASAELMAANRASAELMVANRASAVRVTVMAVSVASAVKATMVRFQMKTSRWPKQTMHQQLLKTEYLRPTQLQHKSLRKSLPQ